MKYSENEEVWVGLPKKSLFKCCGVNFSLWEGA